jgi:hypothetical protein
MQREPTTAAQIKKVHTLKSVLAMSDDDYRAMIKNGFGVESSKHLDLRQAAQLIGILEDKAVAAGVWEKRGWNRTTRISKGHAAAKVSTTLGERGGMATPPQLRKIEAMWSEVSRATPEYRARALRQFVSRIAHVSDLRFLDSAGAGAVINALKKMKERRVEPAHHCGAG